MKDRDYLEQQCDQCVMSAICTTRLTPSASSGAWKRCRAMHESTYRKAFAIVALGTAPDVRASRAGIPAMQNAIVGLVLAAARRNHAAFDEQMMSVAGRMLVVSELGEEDRLALLTLPAPVSEAK